MVLHWFRRISADDIVDIARAALALAEAQELLTIEVQEAIAERRHVNLADLRLPLLHIGGYRLKVRFDDDVLGVIFGDFMRIAHGRRHTLLEHAFWNVLHETSPLNAWRYDEQHRPAQGFTFEMVGVDPRLAQAYRQMIEELDRSGDGMH